MFGSWPLYETTNSRRRSPGYAKHRPYMNLEAPAAFNASLDEFFHQVEAGRWDLRDPRSQSKAILEQKT